MPDRTDNVTDPGLAAQLLLARRGQAVWARALNDLPDADFAGPSRRTGWTRSHVVAHIGFHARAIARLVEGARTGIHMRMYDSDDQHTQEVAFGATLPTEALRNLAAHAAVHLNVEWRDLPEDRWRTLVRAQDERWIPVSDTVAMRAREVWIGAVDLDSGVSIQDIPEALRADSSAGPEIDTRDQGELS